MHWMGRVIFVRTLWHNVNLPDMVDILFSSRTELLTESWHLDLVFGRLRDAFISNK